MKAVLEIPVPETCAECRLWVNCEDSWYDGCAICSTDFEKWDGENTKRAEKERYSECPLKIVGGDLI
jgi:hypothetical protein